jgi:hypothetical protein
MGKTMDLIDELRKYPERLQPNIFISRLNEPIEIVRQGLALRVKKDALPGQIDGAMSFVWMPLTRPVLKLKIYQERKILCFKSNYYQLSFCLSAE